MRLHWAGIVCGLLVLAGGCGDDDVPGDAGVAGDGAVDGGSDAGVTGVRCFDPAPPLPEGDPPCRNGWCRVYPQLPQFAAGGIGGVALDDLWLHARNGAMAHYDGQSWSELAPLNPAPCQVDCSDEDCITPNCTLVAQASDDVWLAGTRWLWHWDGLSWQQSEPPYAMDAGEVQVFRVGERELWLTVWRTYPSVMTTLFRREGDGWVEVAPGLPTISRLRALSGVDASSVWAVAESGEVARWDGAAWSSAELPDAKPYYGFESLAVFGDEDVWLAGDTTLHFDGDWQFIDDRNRTVVFGVSASDVWLYSYQRMRHFDGERLRDVPYPGVLDAFDPDRSESPPVFGAVAGRSFTADARGGLLSFTDGAWRFELGHEQLPSVEVRAVSARSADDLWLITSSGHVVRRTPDGMRVLAQVGSYDDRTGTLFAVTADEAWVLGDSSSGIARVRADGCEPQPLPGVAPRAAAGRDAEHVFVLASRYKHGAETPLLLAYDGSSWREIAFDDDVRPYGPLWADDEGGLWLGGVVLTQDEERERPVLLHWDGERWSRTLLPGGSTIVRAIAGTSARDFWLSAGSDVFHWDGELLQERSPDALDASETGDFERFDVLIVHGDTVEVCSEARGLRWDGDAWQPLASGPVRCTTAIAEDGTRLRAGYDGLYRAESEP